MKLIYLFCIISLVFFVTAARAVETLDYEYTVKGDLPKMRLSSSNEIEFLFSNNRVAKIAYSENKNKYLDLKLTLERSSCELKYKYPICNMSSWLSVYYIKLLWARHPNKKMINTLIEAPAGQNTTVITFLDWTMNFWSNISQKALLFQDYLKESAATTIQCDHLNWVPTNTDTFEKISYEAFSLNYENKTFDKKPVAVFRNVKFLKIKNLLKFSSIKPFYISNVSNLTALASPLASETMILSVKNNNESCSFQFERNTSRALILQKIQNSMTNYVGLKFLSLKHGAAQITQFLSDELVIFEPKYELARKKLPLVIQVLDVLGLAHLEFTTTVNGHIKVVVTIREIS